MTTPTPQIIYKGSPISEEEFPELAAAHKLSYTVIATAVLQLQEKGAIDLTAVSGTTRERVRALSEALSVSVPQEEAEPVEVLYDASEDEEALSDDSDLEPRMPAPQWPTNEKLGIHFGHVESAPMANSNTGNEDDFVTKDEESYEPDRDEYDEVVDHAASGLMQAFSDPQGCFLITPEGICRVNPENPPSIERSYEAVAHIMKLKELGIVIDDRSSWMLGSAVVALEDYHGENNFSVSQVCDTTTKAYNTVITAVGVFKAFPKRYKLSFTHHKEAHYANIPAETKKLVLSKAESHKLGAKQVRSLCSIAKTMGDDTTIRNIRSKGQAETLIDAYRTNKVVYLVFHDKRFWRVKGLGGDPPKHSIVLDTKRWTQRAGDNEPTPIDFLEQDPQ